MGGLWVDLIGEGDRVGAGETEGDGESDVACVGSSDGESDVACVGGSVGDGEDDGTGWLEEQPARNKTASMDKRACVRRMGHLFGVLQPLQGILRLSGRAAQTALLCPSRPG